MILCAGEALIDMLPRRTEAGEDAFAPYPGGAVFNTAIALARLGAPAGMVTGLSTDLFGDVLTAALHESGVADRAIRSDRPTTLAFVTLTDGQARYDFYDENTAARMLTPEDMPSDLEDSDALFFGGISLAVEPCAEAYEALALRASEAGRTIMVDPNIRPGFIRDEARYRARIERMMRAAGIVKLSDEDLHWLRGPGDTGELARGLLEEGPGLVCITEGAKGATGHTANGAVFVAAEPVEVIDTVGAGDTFNAGLLAGLYASDTAFSRPGVASIGEEVLRDALSLGVRAAAVTVSRAGANPPFAREL